MAGKTTAAPKVKKEKPEISMADIDDLYFKVGKLEDDVSDIIETIDGLGLNELALRVGKVEARLGIG